MANFRYGHATAADWREAAESCVAQLGAGSAGLGFLYATDLYAGDLERILAFVKRATGVEHWVGTVGMGICAGAQEYLDQPALALMVGDFDRASFSVLPSVTGAEVLAATQIKCGAAAANFAIVHGDPRNEQIVALIEGLAQKVESGFLVGGLTSSRKQNHQIADGLTHGGVSGVVFSGDVVVATRLTQGCTPVGRKHSITEASRNIIVTLDGKPALEVFIEDIGEEMARNLNRVGSSIFAGLPITGSDTGDYLVRNLVGIDPNQKLIAIGELVETGRQVMFCRRDAAAATQDMKRMLGSIKQGLFGKPRGGVYYSCLGRGAGLFGPDSAELKLISTELGEFPLVGFFGNGEISHNRLYGYTGVLTLFV